MSQCIVPNWNLKHQRQEQLEEEEEEEEEAKVEERNTSSHVLNHNNCHLVPMSNYDQVAELTWENGQLAMHALNGLLPTKPPCAWVRSNDTLESIVHQFTSQPQNLNPKHNFNMHDSTPTLPPNRSSNNVAVASSAGNWPVASAAAALLKKRARSDVDYFRKNLSDGGTMHEDKGDRSACGSGSAAFCRDNDTTMMTWGSLDSPHSMKTAKTMDEDQSACHGGSEKHDEDRETRDETFGRSFSTRRSRAAATHNLSERRRRDRINQKMKTLQKLVPNSSKTDKASMLDEVIEYLKQLQTQVQLMSMRSMPQMMMPLGIQQQQQQLHQMSLLARMGMAGVGLGMGMGMLDFNSMARNASQSLPPLMHPSPLTANTPAFLPPPFVAAPPVVPTRMMGQTSLDASSSGSLPLHDPYSTFLAQSMNMDLYSKMAALYRPQINQTTQTASNPSKSNTMQEN